MKKVFILTLAVTFCMVTGNQVMAQSKTGEQKTVPHQAVSDRTKPYYNDGGGKDRRSAPGTSGIITPASRPSPAPRAVPNSSLGQKRSVSPSAISDHKTKQAN